MLILSPKLAGPATFLDFVPFLVFLPPCNEKNAPNHNEQSIYKVKWAVVSRILVVVVEEGRDNSYNHGEYQPFLHEVNKTEIAIDIWA